MTLLTNKDERFKHLFGKTALFIVLAALGMGGVFLWTGIEKGAFTPKVLINFVADSGQDLNKGMPVKFSGFKIGKLSALDLDEQGQVQVEVSIETKYLSLIHQDAVINLKKEGVIGDGVLEISRGTEGKPALRAGEKVRFERAKGLEQAVNEVKNRVMPILDDVHQMLSDPDGDVRQSLKNMRQLTAEISTLAHGMHGTRQRLDQVLGGVDSNMTNEVTPLLQSLRKSATQAESLLNKADSSMENLRKTTESIDKAVQKSVPQVPGMLGEARETLGKTREAVGSTLEVVDGLKASWPLKGVVPPVETGPVRMDSHD